jgi:hypothetical protein
MIIYLTHVEPKCISIYTEVSAMSVNGTELKAILRTLLSEVQHLRVEQAVLIARLSPGATAADLLDIKKAAIRDTGKEFSGLSQKIEAL